MSLQHINGRLHQILSPRAFLWLMKNDRTSIKRTKVIAPKLGSNSLGKIYVEYNYAPTTTKEQSAATCED